MHKILGVTAATLLLAGCGGPDAEGTISTEDGDVTYTADADGDAVNIDMTGPNGETVAVRGGDAASADLPDGFTAYPGATVVTSTKVGTSDGGGTLLVMTTKDSAAEVTGFYRSQAEAAGVHISNEMTANGMQLIAGEGAGGLAFSVSASPGGDGVTTVQLTIGLGL